MEFQSDLTIGRRGPKPDREVVDRLTEEIGRCPDVAFAHLPEVFVPGRQDRPESVLFVWLTPEALGSLRSSLDLVSAAVSTALPDGDFLDVVVLNSAPELLERVERAGCLLVERDPEERRRALDAIEHPDAVPTDPEPPWWRRIFKP